MNNGISIGKQIKYYRQQKQIKQEELADYLGVSYQAVSKWETGASVPDIALLPQISVYFGVSIDELFQIPYEAEMERIENMMLTERRINDQTFDRAVRFLNDVLKDEPENEQALSNLAALYNHRAASCHELASYYAEQLLEKYPDEKDGWVAYLEANNGTCGDDWYENHFEVISFFEKFLEKNPGNYQGLYAIIENLLADNRYDEAVPYIEQIKSAKKNHQYLCYMGDVAFGKGDVKTARTLWEQMVEEYPDIWQAHCDLGDGYRRLGMYEKALDEYEKCFTMQQQPRIVDGLCSMAQIHEQQKQYGLAINDYERIIDCLKEDYHVKKGEQLDWYLRKIERLRHIAER